MNLEAISDSHQSLKRTYVRRERDIFIVGLFAPLILYFLVLWVLPLLAGLAMSLYSDPTAPTATFVGLENYVAAVAEVDLASVLSRTVVFTLASTVLSVAVGLAFALLLNRSLFGSGFIRSLFIFPYLLPTVVVVLFFVGLMNPNFGFISVYLSKLGVFEEPISLFGSTTYAMPAVVTVAVWKYGSFAFFIFLARLQAIDAKLYERARIEGASQWQQFKHITLPNLYGAIFLVFLIRGIYMFNMFDLIWIATKGGPIDATTTLPLEVYKLSYFSNRLGTGLALAGLMFLVVSLAAVVYFRAFSPAEDEL
jgi:multiple sugar transport system permease protein